MNPDPLITAAGRMLEALRGPKAVANAHLG